MSDDYRKTTQWTDCPSEWELPTYFTIMAHNGEGNPRPIKYINENVLITFSRRVNHEIDVMFTYNKVGDDE